MGLWDIADYLLYTTTMSPFITGDTLKLLMQSFAIFCVSFNQNCHVPTRYRGLASPLLCPEKVTLISYKVLWNASWDTESPPQLCVSEQELKYCYHNRLKCRCRLRNDICLLLNQTWILTKSNAKPQFYLFLIVLLALVWNV